MAFNAGSIDATLDLNRNPFTAGIIAARKEGKDFAKEKFVATAELTVKEAGFKALVARLEKFSKTNYKATADVSINSGAFTGFRTRLENFAKQRYIATAGVRIDDAQLAAFRAQLAEIAAESASATARVDVDRRDFDDLIIDLGLFARVRATARVDVDTGNSLAALAALRAAMASVRDETVDLNGEIRSFGNNDGFGRANSRFAKLFGAIVAGSPVIGAAIIGLLGIIGGLGGALTIAGVAAGAFGLVAVSVFKDISSNAEEMKKTTAATASAFSALESARSSLARAQEQAASSEAAALRSISDAEENLARTTQDAAQRRIDAARAVSDAVEGVARARENGAEREAAAARQVADAEEALGEARIDAGQAAEQAARQVEDAERGLTSAQRDAQQAQEDLTQARRDAVEELEDLQLALRGGALSEEQAILNLEKAQLRYNEALAEGVSGNELKQLELDIRQAALATDVAKERYIDLQQESAEFAKTGIEGSRGVRDAQGRLVDANLQVGDAERAVSDARADQSRTAIESQRDIEKAQRDVAEARADQSKAALDSQREIQRAERDLADARQEAAKVEQDAQRDIRDAERDLSDARADAARTTIDGQRQIADALRAVAEAQLAYSDALAKQTKELSPSMKLAEDALNRLKAAYEDLKKRTEGGISLAFVANFDAVTAFLGTLDGVIDSASRGFERVGRMAEAYFNGPQWKEFTTFLEGTTEPVLVRIFEAIGNGVQGVINLVEAFYPLTDFMLDGLVTGMRDFADVTERLGDDPAFQDFLEAAKQAIPQITDFIGSLIGFIFNLSMGLAPLGGLMLDLLTSLFDGLNKLPPEWVAAIAISVAAVWAAIALGATGPVGIAIGVIAGLAVLFADAYAKNEELRTGLEDFGNTVKGFFQPVFENLSAIFEDRILPAFEDLRSAIVDNLLPAIGDFLVGAAPFAAFFTEVIGVVALDIFERFIKIVTGLINGLAGIFKVATGILTGDWDLFWNGLRETGEGALNIFLGVFNTSLDTIGTDFETWKNDFVGTWDTFWNGIEQVSSDYMGDVNVAWSDMFAGIDETLGLKSGATEAVWIAFWTDVRIGFQREIDMIKAGWDGYWADAQAALSLKSSEISTSWNTFWFDVKADAKQYFTDMGLDWLVFWDDNKVTQDVKQNDSSMSWLEHFASLLVDLTNFKRDAEAAWTAFWGVFSTEQNDKQGVVKGSWNTWLADLYLFMRDTFNNIQTFLMQAWDNIVIGVNQAAARIDMAWRGVANIFRDPINWVINTVLNDGVLRSWNTLMGWIGQPALSVGRIGELPRFADGGEVRGGVPNKDSVTARLMPGEYVLSKRMIDNLGGLPNVHMIAQAAKNSTPGTLSPQANTQSSGQARQALMRKVPNMDDLGRMQMAYGGVAPHVAAAGDEITRLFGRMPGGIGGVGARAGASDHPKGLALDFMTLSNKPLGDKVTSHFLANAGRLAMKYIIWQQSINSGSGFRKMEDRGSITANHYDHPHVSFKSGKGGLADWNGGTGSFGAALPDGMASSQTVSWWSQLADQAMGMFNGLMPKSIPGMGGPLGDATLKVPRKWLDQTIDAAKNKLSNLFTEIGGAFGGGDTGPGTGPVVGQVRNVARNYGWDVPPQWDALARLIQKESSWNPAAQNPKSTAYGLFQFLNSTWATVGATKTSNPTQQAVAGLKYIKQRYSDPIKALKFHNANNYYDEGGVLQPGTTLSVNATGRPEAVLTAPQWEAIMKGGVNGGGINAEEIEQIIARVMLTMPAIHIGSIQTTPRATAQEILAEAVLQVKHARRQGVHTR